MQADRAEGTEAPTVAMIVEAFRQTYTEDGVAVLLGGWSRDLDGRPIDLMRTEEGRRRVYKRAVALFGQVAS